MFDTNTAAQIMGVPNRHAAVLLHAATKRGLVTHIKRGLYNLVPFELGSTTFNLEDRYVLVHESLAGKPYFLSHASAMEIHQLTTQPNFEVYVTVLNRLDSLNLGGSPVHFVTSRPDRFFGYEHRAGSPNKICVADIERALLDGLVRPHYCAGLVEVAKAFFIAKGRFSTEKLTQYCRRFGSGAAIRRMGFLLEVLGLATAEELAAIAASLPPATVKLDPDAPLSGPHIAKWGLRQNIDTDEILQATRT